MSGRYEIADAMAKRRREEEAKLAPDVRAGAEAARIASLWSPPPPARSSRGALPAVALIVAASLAIWLVAQGLADAAMVQARWPDVAGEGAP